MLISTASRAVGSFIILTREAARACRFIGQSSLFEII